MNRLLCTAAAALALMALAGCEIYEAHQLQNTVRDALKADPRTAQFSLEVSADAEGVVTITGEVSTPGDSGVVTEVAQAVPGVARVVNRTAVPDHGSGLMQDTVVPGIGGMGF